MGYTDTLAIAVTLGVASTVFYFWKTEPGTFRAIAGPAMWLMTVAMLVTTSYFSGARAGASDQWANDFTARGTAHRAREHILWSLDSASRVSAPDNKALVAVDAAEDAALNRHVSVGTVPEYVVDGWFVLYAEFFLLGMVSIVRHREAKPEKDGGE